MVCIVTHNKLNETLKELKSAQDQSFFIDDNCTFFARILEKEGQREVLEITEGDSGNQARVKKKSRLRWMVY